jgi:preprotein translocase subunit SecF
VVFDRIRDNLKAMRRSPFPQIVNASINQTLSRTLLTSLTTMLVVLSLLFLGGQVINNFAFALMVGVITGTYSSIFVASPILAFWQKILDNRSRPGKK